MRRERVLDTVIPTTRAEHDVAIANEYDIERAHRLALTDPLCGNTLRIK